MLYYIYKIENKINNKKYIGLTCNIKRRHLRHFTDLRCKRHDNGFLQSEFIKYGEENFIFDELLNGDFTDFEIGELEKEYIKKYDSYRNGYNQNEGGNFGASNGGTKLILSDLLNILSVLEFMSKPGQVLSDMYDVTRTTISRIKKGINHQYAQEVYFSMEESKRKEIFNKFMETTNFYKDKINSTIIKGKRKLTREQVYMILVNEERKIVTKRKLSEIINVKSTNTINCVLNKNSYKDYIFDYNKLKNYEKDEIASLFSNK